MSMKNKENKWGKGGTEGDMMKKQEMRNGVYCSYPKGCRKQIMFMLTNQQQICVSMLSIYMNKFVL